MTPTEPGFYWAVAEGGEPEVVRVFEGARDILVVADTSCRLCLLSGLTFLSGPLTPPGIEPKGCPTPGACSCVTSTDATRLAAAIIAELRRDCAELYQVIGVMAEYCPDPDHPSIIKALDNASDAANGDPRRHDDLLPFVMPGGASERLTTIAKLEATLAEAEKALANLGAESE